MTTLGVHIAVLLAVVVVVLAVTVLVLIVAPPWRSVRDEPPLDEDIESRLLLGEDPEKVAADVDADAHRASAVELDTNRTDAER